MVHRTGLVSTTVRVSDQLLQAVDTVRDSTHTIVASSVPVTADQHGRSIKTRDPIDSVRVAEEAPQGSEGSSSPIETDANVVHEPKKSECGASVRICNTNKVNLPVSFEPSIFRSPLPPLHMTPNPLQSIHPCFPPQYEQATCVPPPPWFINSPYAPHYYHQHRPQPVGAPHLSQFPWEMQPPPPNIFHPYPGNYGMPLFNGYLPPPQSSYMHPNMNSCPNHMRPMRSGSPTSSDEPSDTERALKYDI